MRKLVEATFVSLDGVVEAPGLWGYQYFSAEENMQASFARLAACDALLLGRVTFEELKGLSEQRKGDRYFERIAGIPKFVPSRTLEKAGWSATVLKGDIGAEVLRLKQLPGKNIVKYGTGVLDKTLVEHGLIDEFHISVFPVVVGKGRRLFEGVDTTHLKLSLISTKRFENGVVTHVYSSGK